MTNREYLEKNKRSEFINIMDAMERNESHKPFCDFIRSELDFCINASCCMHCGYMFANWLNEEYKVDWSKVPIDTKVIVTAYDGDVTRRYFAGVDAKGLPMFFGNGATSFTSNHDTYSVGKGKTFVDIQLYDESEE